MRIAQINPGYMPIPPTNWGAVEKIIWQYYLELVKLGHDVDIKYLNEIHKDEYDIVHVHMWNHALELYEKGIPYVFTCHDHNLYINGKDTKIYQDNLLAMKLAELSIVPAEYLVEYFDDFPIYLEHGVSLDYYELNDISNEHKLLCVGNNGISGNIFFDRKGFKYAIEASKKLDLPITIVGPSDNNKNFFDKHKDLLKHNVILKYDVTPEELKEIYRTHSILVHATSIEAGHPPLTILEAAASGLPVITTDCSGDLHATNVDRDVDDVVDKIQYVIDNYIEERTKTIDSVKNFDWKNVVAKLNGMYEKISKTDMKHTALRIYNKVKRIKYDNVIEVHFIGAPNVKITGQIDESYNIKFIDTSNNDVVYDTNLSTNSWARANKSHFVKWKIVITDSKNRVIEHNLDLKDKKVLLYFDSSSIGDTLAWIPYVDEFRKKYECETYVFTFHNNLFRDVYPEVNFVDKIENFFYFDVSYKIGWYYTADKKFDSNLHKNPANEIPLQQTITDIIGLDYKEIKPKVKNLPVYQSKTPYICIATHSTAQAKYWNNPSGWQELVDYVKSQGYDVYLVSKEEDGFMGNRQPTGVIKISGKSLEELGSIIKGAKFFVGLGSGLTWYSWALNVPTILISGFSEPWQEMKSDIIRVINEDVCHGCFAKHAFDRGDWNWCPEHKGTQRQFECTKSITFDMVKPHIENLLKM
jgi:autotransporter strand-loop-strand O-heptosyltransferase